MGAKLSSNIFYFARGNQPSGKKEGEFRYKTGDVGSKRKVSLKGLR